MKLFTEKQRTALLANGAQRGADHVPVVKLFNPSGSATWLLSELDPEYQDECGFGLADLGFGTPELGSVGLAELSAYRGPFGLGIERDLHFTGSYPLSIYAVAARAAGHIVETGPELEAAARSRADQAVEDRPASPPPAHTMDLHPRDHHPMDPRRGENLSPQFAAFLCWLLQLPPIAQPAITGISVTGGCVFAATAGNPVHDTLIGAWADFGKQPAGLGRSLRRPIPPPSTASSPGHKARDNKRDNERTRRVSE